MKTLTDKLPNTYNQTVALFSDNEILNEIQAGFNFQLLTIICDHGTHRHITRRQLFEAIMKSV